MDNIKKDANKFFKSHEKEIDIAMLMGGEKGKYLIKKLFVSCFTEGAYWSDQQKRKYDDI